MAAADPSTIAPSPTRPPIDIGVLKMFLDSLSSFSHDLIQHLQSGAKLCHYTDLDGLNGIVSGDDLWLTNSRFSNDDEEQVYGIKVCDAVLDAAKEAAKNDPTRLDWLQQVHRELGTAVDDQVYICCFCEKENLLSQWRGYAANGASIEFDAKGFSYATGPDSAHGLMSLWRVIYDPERQRSAIQAALDFGWPQPDTVRHAVDAIKFFVPAFKNPDFREEQERRLIFTPQATASAKPRFRSRRGLLVPYYSLKELSTPPGAAVETTPRLPIRNILVGLGPNKLLNVRAVRMLLDRQGHDDVPVLASTTPFRG
jgi:hypothetical protein